MALIADIIGYSLIVAGVTAFAYGSLIWFMGSADAAYDRED